MASGVSCRDNRDNHAASHLFLCPPPSSRRPSHRPGVSAGLSCCLIRSNRKSVARTGRRGRTEPRDSQRRTSEETPTNSGDRSRTVRSSHTQKHQIRHDLRSALVMGRRRRTIMFLPVSAHVSWTAGRVLMKRAESKHQPDPRWPPQLTPTHMTAAATDNKLDFAVVVADTDLQHILWAQKQEICSRFCYSLIGVNFVSKISYKLLEGFFIKLEGNIHWIQLNHCLPFGANPVQDGCNAKWP